MSERHPTTAAKPNKPAKPFPDYPLTAHPAGYWCKKIRGRLHYFGPWSDPDGALARYLEQKDDLHAGRAPRPDTGAVTVKDACNAFLNFKQARVDAGELSAQTWANYKCAADLLVSHTGKTRLVADLRPADFTALRDKMAKRWGPHRLAMTIICVRGILKYAYDTELIDRPVRFGPGFKGPSKKTMRLHRVAQGPKLFTAEQVRLMIDGAPAQLRGMILLGINCGLGNSDCARLPLSALDLDRGWLDFPRPKTGMPRRCPLWPETIEAMRQTLAKRRVPPDGPSAPAFATRRGPRDGRQYPAKAVIKEFERLLDKLGITGRKGLGFYTLRHTFRTVADAAKDQPAADFIMGHEVPHMSSVYREGIDDARLKAVTDHVHAWLFPNSP
jgi:integrase